MKNIAWILRHKETLVIWRGTHAGFLSCFMGRLAPHWLTCALPNACHAHVQLQTVVPEQQRHGQILQLPTSLMQAPSTPKMFPNTPLRHL